MRTPPALDFLDTNYNNILADLIQQFEALTGRILAPAQVERILIDLMSYEGTNQRIAMKDAILQAFPQFARTEMLDLHAEANGLKRLPAQSARTLVEFTLNSVQATDTIIGTGQKVGSKDNAFIFTTSENITIPAGNLTGEARAVAGQTGAGGSGYLVGEVANLLVPIPKVLGAANSTVTSGGADAEQDEELLIRILLAITTASTAGPKNSYIAIARSAHSSIVDVQVLGPNDHGIPGTVRLYTITRTGPATTEIKDLVLAAVTPSNTRPMTDFVEVLDPVSVPYSITLNLRLLNTADIAAVQEAATAAVQAIADEWALKLGTDIVPSALSTAADITGVHSVEVVGPAYAALADNQWPELQLLTVNIVELTNG